MDEDNNKIQQNLNEIYLWSEKSSMEFNSDKFNSILFSSGNPVVDEKLSTLSPLKSNDGTDIKKVAAVNDLGVWISQDLNFELNIQHVKKKCWRSIHLVLRTFKTRDPQIMKTLWQTICLGHLTYGTVVMGKLPAHQERQIERCQKKFTSLMKLNGTPSYVERLVMLKLNSIQRLRQLLMIQFTAKMIEQNQLHTVGLRLQSTLQNRNGILLQPVFKPPRKEHKQNIYFNKSFCSASSTLWNALPKDLRNKAYCKSFKNSLQFYTKDLRDDPFAVYSENRLEHLFSGKFHS